MRGASPATFPRPGRRLGTNSTAEGRPERVGGHAVPGEGATERSDALDGWGEGARRRSEGPRKDPGKPTRRGGGRGEAGQVGRAKLLAAVRDRASLQAERTG